MKQMSLVLAIFALCAASVAQAASLEAVLVTAVTIRGDREPPVRRPVLTDSAEIGVTVMSNGCTTAADFEVQVVYTTTANEVSIVRTNPDKCEAFAHPVSIVLKSSNFNGDLDVVVKNPLMVYKFFAL